MKIPVIKGLVEQYSVETLMQAESDIVEEMPLKIEVEGADEGEKLTHVIAAIWIIAEMKHQNLDFKEALRAYTTKVRSSIS